MSEELNLALDNMEVDVPDTCAVDSSDVPDQPSECHQLDSPENSDSLLFQTVDNIPEDSLERHILNLIFSNDGVNMLVSMSQYL